MNRVIKVSDETKEKMIKYYEKYKRNKEIPYVVFQAEQNGTVVTMYESGKIMFQGVTADVDSAMWQELDGQHPEEEQLKDIKSKYYNVSAVGSDEVGTGDYFGPIVVTSTYVPKDLVKDIEKLGITDSKKMTDEYILKIAPKLSKMVKYRTIILNNEEYNERYSKAINMNKIKKIVPELIKRIKYKSQILSNAEYNEKYSNEFNMNKIKSVMHNKVLWRMVHEEDVKYDYIIIDEFAKENRYYGYNEGNPNIQRGITFFPQAEDKCLAVAAASVISRYIFLAEFDKICDSVHLPLPKGAGKDVDEMGKEVVEKYGKEKLKEIAKYNFKNTERILEIRIM